MPPIDSGIPPDEFSRKLLFDVLDFEEVNCRYIEWKISGDPVLSDDLQIWIYVFSHRYLTAKQAYVTSMTQHDVDSLTADVLLKINRNVHTIQHPEKFVNYVTRACRNEMLSYLRKRRLIYHSNESNPWDRLNPEPPIDTYPLDRSVMEQHLDHALRRLPPAMEFTIRKRFIEEVSYEDLQKQTGFSYGTLRNYVHRGMTILRHDPLLVAFMEEWEAR